MLNYEKELKKFHPISETGDVEELVYNKDLTDLTDLMKEILEKQDRSKEE